MVCGNVFFRYKYNSEQKKIYWAFFGRIMRWRKWRSKYFVLSWCFSTNHKRIAINYFWFVLLAGLVGMSLATLIRLELAYPGIGVLAGDSTQYLTIVTAHGIVMVFFMAIPLLFGFFRKLFITYSIRRSWCCISSYE